MELRTLNYFRTVADEGNITNAANVLHVTQPTLSRQIAQLEAELGQPLFVRGHGGVELTERGTILYRYACDILDLASKAEADVGAPGTAVNGVVHIGAGETKAMGLLGRAMRAVRQTYPGISFDVRDGTTAELMELLVKGFLDVLLECDLQPHENLNCMQLPVSDVWGAIVREDSPLAKLDVVTRQDLEGQAVMLSSQGLGRKFGTWAGDSLPRMDVVATYELPLNCKFLVEEDCGALITYGGLVDDWPRGGLCFRELAPKLEARHGLLWRKTLTTPQTQVFLDELRRVCAG